jgi:hypothetical protein
MVATAKRDLTRLEALRQGEARLQVDRAFPGRIWGASIITTGPALGHGFEIDRTTVEQVTEFAAGTRGRWTHGGLSEDGLGRHLGTWENVRMESFWLCRACGIQAEQEVCGECGREAAIEWRSVGDFAFASSAHKIRPDGLDAPAPVYLMERAQEDPSSLGISIVARFGTYEPPAREGEERQRRFARLESKRDLRRGDWVADPAANPVGLHEGTRAPSALTEEATRELDQIVRRNGAAEAKLRALAFLTRYFGDDPGSDESSQDEEQEDRLAALQAQLDEQTKELASLRVILEGYEAAEEIRHQDEKACYLESLRQQSAELNAPVAAADLAEVERLLEGGDLKTAKVLGEALLARSRAEGQSAFTRGETTSLAADPKDRKKASIAARVSVLRRRGWHVETNQDGTEIVRAAPKSAGR